MSLLSPGYLLSVEQRRFHKQPPDHYALLSHLLDLLGLAVKLPFAIALDG